MKLSAHRHYLEHREEFFGDRGHQILLKRLAMHFAQLKTGQSLVVYADIGSASGKFLRAIDKMVPEQNAIILGFEPNPLNFEVFAGIETRSPLKLFNCALSDETGRQTLSTIMDHPDNRAGYTLASLRGNGRKIGKVNVETFDNVVNGLKLDDFVIRYVKIDTEGNDTKEIRGMQQHLPRLQYMVFESSDCLDDYRGPSEAAPLKGIVDLLDQNGFDTYKIGTRRLLKMNGEDWHEVFEVTKFHSNCFSLKKGDPFMLRISSPDGTLLEQWHSPSVSSS
jgi:FkbM family methyltransferase